MKRTIIEFLIGLPVIIIGFFLLDYLYCTFITHSPFVFNVQGCGIAVAVWAVVEIVTFIIRSKNSK